MSILPLELDGITVSKRGKRIIGPVDFHLSPDGFTVLLGPNGSGKTTLLRAMHGIERLSAGDLRWQVARADAELRQSFVFQAPIILRRSVLDNVAYPLTVRGTARAEARAQAVGWVEKIGLGGAQERPARVLSGGEKQKLALARALITDPEVLFLDEPTANLDGRATREIEGLLAEASARGTRIVMATHDLGQARRLATEIAFVYGGNIHEAAETEMFFAEPQTVQAAAFIRGDIVE